MNTNDLDPSEATPTQTQQGDTQAGGPGRLRQAWDAWTSRPENNAALLQFGIAMMQPRPVGQSALGQTANALGSASEAASGNVATQQSQQHQATEEDIKQQEADTHKQTARAYSRQVDQTGAGGKGDKFGTQAALRAQGAFNKWATTPSMGLPDDIVDTMKRSHPDITTKSDILNNPVYRREALQLFTAMNPAVGGEGGEGENEPSAPATTKPQIIYKGKVPYQWDGIPGHPPVPMQQ